MVKLKLHPLLSIYMLSIAHVHAGLHDCELLRLGSLVFCVCLFFVVVF